MRSASGLLGHAGRRSLQTSRWTNRLRCALPAVSLTLNVEVF